MRTPEPIRGQYRVAAVTRCAVRSSHVVSLGANTVRVVLTGSSTAADISNVIDLCKQNRLICVLENRYDRLCDQGAITLDQAVSFWNARRGVLTDQESYIIVNIGNEPFGNNGAAAWTDATISAIQRKHLRPETGTVSGRGCDHDASPRQLQCAPGAANQRDPGEVNP